MDTYTEMEENMRFKKFMAISLVAMLSTASLFGCGKKEDGEGTDKKTEKTEEKDDKASVESLSEMLKMTEGLEKYTMDAEYKLSIESDAFAEEEEVAEVLEMLDIDPEKIEVTLGYDGTVCGTEAGAVSLSYELGKLSGVITEVVYVDETVYINVGSILDIVEDVGELLDMDTEMDAMLTLLPDEDYLAIPMDDLTEVGEAMMEAIAESSGMSLDDLKDEMEKVDEEAVLDATYYMVDVVEKILKETDDAYSTKDGISVTINNKNLNSFVESALTVIVEDATEIVKELEVITGDLGVSEDEIKEAMKDVDIKEVMEEFKEEMEGFDEACDFSVDYDINYEDDTFKTDMKMVINVKEEPAVKMTMSANASIKKDEKAKVEAPKSVISEEDVEAFVGLMGFDSVDDFKEGLIDSFTVDDSYVYEDEYSDYDFEDYEDYDFSDDFSYDDELDIQIDEEETEVATAIIEE